VTNLFGQSPPIKVLSVRQPWAWLIIAGHKVIENRTWPTTYRGPLLIHAASKMDGNVAHGGLRRRFALPETLDMGAIIGRVTLVHIVTHSESPWFDGPFGWVFDDPRPVGPFKLRGRLGLFDAPEAIVAACQPKET
jgi:hypothetical protein